MIAIDQSPIGRTPGRTRHAISPDDIRLLYAQLPDAKTADQARRFSFNVAGGRCESLQGNGPNLEMDFLAEIWVTSPVCEGHRFNHETLQVRYKGKSIAQVLDMDVQQALEHFQNIPKIRHKLQTLHDVGLDYLKLGQPSPTLSGGEAQRIKLARELIKISTGRTLYLLDEPTTGLHFADIELLLRVLHDFVDTGNTVLVVEHNMEVIKTADWIIDLGPEGGEDGGRLVAAGTPEEVARTDGSHTGLALRAVLGIGSRQRRAAAAPASHIQPATAIKLRGAGQHNLKNLDVEIPRDRMTVCCGPSGSGKTSLAMDTVYAEGQRRYVESLSAYARQFVGQMQKPKLEHIEGLSPAIAIEQKHAEFAPLDGRHRDEIYDYRESSWPIGQPCCRVRSADRHRSTDEIVAKVMAHPGTAAFLIARSRCLSASGTGLWGKCASGCVRVRIDSRFMPRRGSRHRSAAALG